MDGDECLETIRNIRPVSYRYKASADDSQKNIGFIAQEVEELVPQSVIPISNMIENVSKYGTLNGNIITMYEPHGLAQELNSTGKIKIIVRETEKKEKEYLKLDYQIINDYSISVDGIDIIPWSNEVFVYGCEVSDFRTLDPMPILITALSAIKKMDSIITNLQERITQLENSI